MKAFLSFFFCICAHLVCATNYYVSSIIGNNANDGLSPAAPFTTIQTALDLTAPGDTVFVMNGLYTNPPNDFVANITTSGTSANWIVLMAMSGHLPKIEFGWWVAIGVEGASYIEVNGFEIEGNNDNVTLAQALSPTNNGTSPLFGGNGISLDPVGGNFPHHVRIIGNTVYKCGGNGISSTHADYVFIEGNLVYDCGWYSVFQESGISMYQLRDWDSNFGALKNTIRNNILHNNYNFVPVFGSNPPFFTDGNGIIIDDSHHTQNGSPHPSYQSFTLIENNLIFNNGGAGINIFESDNVYVGNNTCHANGQHPDMLSAELSANQINGVEMFNNIASCGPDSIGNFAFPIGNVLFDYNLYFNDTLNSDTGANAIFADPLFVNPSLSLATADFSLLPSSPARDVAFAPNASVDDLLFVPRPQCSGYDLGAYEFMDNFTLSLIGDTLICLGKTTMLDAGNGYTGYTWSTGAVTQTISVNSAGVFSVTVTDANGCTGSGSSNVVVAPTPNLSPFATTTECTNPTGTVAANPSGGSPPYTYLWDTGDTTASVSNLLPDTYTVILTDANGCTATNSATILPSSSNSTLLTAAIGTFDDGSGVADYANNADCQWLIEPPYATHIALSFTVFNTETGTDVVRIYDGDSATDPLLGTFSGTAIPAPVVSTGGSMLVHFTTNGNGTAAGWEADYEADSCPVDLNVTGNPITGGTYFAGNSITSDGKVATGSEVIFDAGSEVDLTIGFEVGNGAVFEVKTGEGCGGM